MASENLNRDQNFVTVIGAITNDSAQEVRMLRVDPMSNRVLVSTGSGGLGTVTSVSVVSANGFAGTVATATTTPAITLSTTVTGILIGDGTAVSSVTVGTGLSLIGSTLSATGAGTVTSVSGTTNRITSTGGTTPVIDISASYVGQSSITTLGTITTGVWNGTAIANANLANSTISGIALGGTLGALTATDATLTFSGSYTGAAAQTVGLNLGHTNTWTALPTIQINSLGTSPGDGLYLQNSTAAAAGAQQISPNLHFQGQGWGTTAPASVPIDFTMNVLPVQGTTATGTWQLNAQINGGGYTAIFTVNTNGDAILTHSIVAPIFASDGGSTTLAFAGSTTTANANFGLVTTGSVSTSEAGLLFGGATNINYRQFFNAGATSTTIGASNSYAGSVFGSGTTTMPASGTTAFVANVVVNNLGTVTNAQPITITNSASLLVFGTPSAAATNNHQIINAYDATHYTYWDTTSAGNAQFGTLGGSQIQFNNAIASSVAASSGAIQSSTTAATSNFATTSTGSGANTNQSGLPFGGAASVNYRTIFNGSSSSTITINASYSNLIIGSSPVTMPASGVAAWLANLVVNPLGTVTNAQPITITNSATLYVGAASSAASNNYSIYNVSGNTLLANGNLTLGTAGNALFITEGTNGRVGQVALVSGTKAITITGITTSSRAFITLVSPVGTTATVEVQAVCTSNTLTIQANVAAGTINTADTSTFNYFVIN